MNRRKFLCRAGCAGVVLVCGCRAKVSVKPEDFSYCGIDCKSCDVFKATVHGDFEARLRAAQKWAKTAQEHWGMKTLDPQTLDCRGCRVTEVKHKGHGRCPILPCARKRGLASCGLCPEWRQCQRVGGVFQDEPQARENLEKVASANPHRKRDSRP